MRTDIGFDRADSCATRVRVQVGTVEKGAASAELGAVRMLAIFTYAQTITKIITCCLQTVRLSGGDGGEARHQRSWVLCGC